MGSHIVHTMHKGSRLARRSRSRRAPGPITLDLGQVISSTGHRASSLESCASRPRGRRGLNLAQGRGLTCSAATEKIFQKIWPEFRGPNPDAVFSLDAFDSPDLLMGAAEVERILLDVARRRLTGPGSLWEFVKAAWPIIEPEQDLTENWHLVELCRVLEDVSAGKIKRLIINVPPGTLKSILVSVFWPAWSWARRPGLRFLTASYGAHLTTRDNLKVRDIVTSPWFQRLFPMRLLEDQNTKTRFNTDKGGWRIATSVGGVGTGEHPDVIVIDDPTTADQAASPADRKAANAWFDRTVSTRGMTRPGLAIVVIMQRLHEEDLSGHLLARGGAEHVRWPMRYEKCACELPEGRSVADLPADARCPVHKADAGWRADPRDPRTTPGELLIPSLIPEEKVRQLELDLGPYGAAGQLQQRPSPEGGGLFQREWFKYISLAELQQDPIVRRVRGWDTASTKDGGDWTRGVPFGETRSGKFVVLTPVGGQLSPDGVDKLMKATADADGFPQREEKEGGASGRTVIEARTKLLAGVDYAGVTVSGNKATRVKPLRSQCEGGNLYLLRGDWNAEYVTELCAFPNAKNDDYVDGSSCAFNSLLLEPYHEVQVRETQWG